MKPVQISSEAEGEIKNLLVNWWAAVNQQLGAATGETILLGEAPVDLLYTSEIGQRLVRIAQAAEGSLRWTEKKAAEIVEDCEAFEAWLNGTPVTHHTPEEFWNTPVGFIVLQARLWAEKDRLISLSEAAEVSRLSLSAISQRISRGQIPSYRAPGEPNPQRARRIRHSDLMLLLEQGIVRKPHAVAGFNVGSQSFSPAGGGLSTHVIPGKPRSHRSIGAQAPANGRGKG
jgi:hypothetical protein